MRFGLTHCFRAPTRWLNQWLLIATFGFMVAGSAMAQDATFEDLKKQWQTLETKLGEKEAELDVEGADLEKIQKEYSGLIGEAETLIEKLESAAYAKLKTEPTNQECVRTLMGILLNDAQNGRDAKVLSAGDELIKSGINSQYFEIASKSDRLSIAAREIFDELIIRQTEAIKNDLPRVKFKTTQGDIVLELFENEAPETVGNFISLVKSGWYSNKLFHRVIEDFMAQTGGFELDENGEQIGGKGPGYEIECECYKPDTRQHFTGSLSMAHRGKDTGGSQLFLTLQRTGFLDGKHTCFGRVIEGSRTLELLARTHTTGPDGRDVELPGVTKDKIVSAEVIRKRDHRYRPNKVGVDEAAEDAAAEKAKAEKAAAEKAEREKKMEEEKAAADAKKKADKEAPEKEAKQNAGDAKVDKADKQDGESDKE